MNKKHIKMLEEESRLQNKLYYLKSKLDEQIDDGKIFQKITFCLAILTIGFLGVGIVTALTGLTLLFANIGLIMAGVTLLEGFIAIVSQGFGWSDKLFNGIKNKILKSKIKKISRKISDINMKIDSKDFKKL